MGGFGIVNVLGKKGGYFLERRERDEEEGTGHVINSRNKIRRASGATISVWCPERRLGDRRGIDQLRTRARLLN